MKVHTINGGNLGSNSYAIQEDNQVVLIDFVPEIENRFADEKIELFTILLTHIHWDHFEGLADFQKKYPCRILMSSKAYEQINNSMFNLSAFMGMSITKVDLAKAEILENGDVFTWKGHDIKVMYSPGHSEDSVVYIIDEIKTIFTGDTIFRHGIGRYDLPTSDYQQLCFSIKTILTYCEEEYIFFPGHGPSTSSTIEKKINVL